MAWCFDFTTCLTGMMPRSWGRVSTPATDALDVEFQQARWAAFTASVPAMASAIVVMCFLGSTLHRAPVYMGDVTSIGMVVVALGVPGMMLILPRAPTADDPRLSNAIQLMLTAGILFADFTALVYRHFVWGRNGGTMAEITGPEAWWCCHFHTMVPLSVNWAMMTFRVEWKLSLLISAATICINYSMLSGVYSSPLITAETLQAMQTLHLNLFAITTALLVHHVTCEFTDKRQFEADKTRVYLKSMAYFNHELRTPLNGIMGSIACLKSTMDACDGIDPNQRATWAKLMTRAEISTKVLVHLVNGILDFTSLNAGTFVEHSAPILDFARLVEESILLVEQQALLRGLTISAQVRATRLAPHHATRRRATPHTAPARPAGQPGSNTGAAGRERPPRHTRTSGRGPASPGVRVRCEPPLPASLSLPASSLAPCFRPRHAHSRVELPGRAGRESR
jgi:hypothetical protein